MSRKVFIGIDGGGGTTECLLADDKGRILGKGLSGGSNIYSSGGHNTALALKDSMLMAGLREDDVVIAACFGLSGVIHGLENIAVRNIVQEILPDTEKIIIVCDAITTLTGSIGLGAGICMNAGTGAICAGRNSQGEFAISSGWGHLLGDEGSGYWIGSQGLISALRSYDGRSAKTELLEKLINYMGTDSPQYASQLIHISDNPRKIFSDLCPVVLNCAENGDVIAYDIVKRAGYELALAVWSVANKLFMTNENNKIAPVGNCLLKSDLLQKLFKEALEDLLPYSTVISPKYAPAVGSLLMALLDGGIECDVLDMESYSSFISKQLAGM